MTFTDSPAVAFFVEHAGWSYDPSSETADEGKLRGARELARAEAWAEREGITFQWEDDWAVDHAAEYPDCYGLDSTHGHGGPDTCEGCMAVDEDGETVLASLWCIDDATTEYRRVVEAELAQEALYTREAREGC